MARGGALLLQFVEDQIFERRIDVEAALDLRVSNSGKKNSHDLVYWTRRASMACVRRDAASYAHVRHEARLDRPGRRVVSTEKLHLLLVGAHGRRDLLAEGRHGSFLGRRCCLSKECCSLLGVNAARRRRQAARGAS